MRGTPQDAPPQGEHHHDLEVEDGNDDRLALALTPQHPGHPSLQTGLGALHKPKVPRLPSYQVIVYNKTTSESYRYTPDPLSSQLF